MKKTVAVLAVLMAAALAGPLRADEGTPPDGIQMDSNSFFFLDYKPRQEGDLVTVMIMESAQASKRVSSKTNKKAGTTAGISATGIDEALKLDTDSKYAGDSSTERRGSLVAKVTATVIEVLPNGNLVIDGRQNIDINGEKQTIAVSGIIRPKDIDSNNTVMSSAIADAKIEYTGKEKRKNVLHWLGPIGWVLNWLF